MRNKQAAAAAWMFIYGGAHDMAELTSKIKLFSNENFSLPCAYREQASESSQPKGEGKSERLWRWRREKHKLHISSVRCNGHKTNITQKQHNPLMVFFASA
jgi:hypothetical protein